MNSTPLTRILDAESNRAAEGLRVVEDYLRFALDDRHLTELAKQLRHDLAAALKPIEALDRHRARDTQADVGTTITTEAEPRRADLADVAAANFERVLQALRSLEEFGKVESPQLGAAMEAIRYRSYTLQRAIGITAASAARLADVRLYVLADGCDSEAAFAKLIAALVSAGVGAIQLRDKQLDDRTLIARARLLRDLTRGTQTLAIINDRPDIAALAQADGVHVGQEELSVKDARAIVGPRPLIGLSTHDIDQARAAVLAGADYLGVGPTFPSTTKSFDAFAGLKFIRQVAAEIRLPAFPIGGITAQNIDQVRQAGLHRAAIGAAITAAEDPAVAAKDLLARLA
jgi:thiamine-phosphate pyrophosphorylase